MREFKTITDNRKIIEYLSKANDCGRLSHAYIINGIGQEKKRELIEYIVGAVLCNRTTSVSHGPCGKCAACTKVLTNNHPDLIWVKGEKKDIVSVDDIRQQIVDDVQIKPYYGSHKIYIMENADTMTISAQNALLKTIEEPPVYTTIFLLTENTDILLDTIRSRCVRMDIEKILEDTTEEKYRFWVDIVKRAGNMKAVEISQISESIEKANLSCETEILRMWFRDVLLYKSGFRGRLYFAKEKKTIARMSESMSYEKINSIINEIDETQSRVKASVKKQAAMECLLLNLRKNLKEKEKEQW